MHQWKVFYENADTDEPKRFIGMIDADTESDALHKASQYFEVPAYDLVVEQIDKNQLWPPRRKDN